MFVTWGFLYTRRSSLNWGSVPYIYCNYNLPELKNIVRFSEDFVIKGSLYPGSTVI